MHLTTETNNVSLTRGIFENNPELALNTITTDISKFQANYKKPTAYGASHAIRRAEIVKQMPDVCNGSNVVVRGPKCVPDAITL